MSFNGLLIDKCVIFRKSEGTPENEWGNSPVVLSVLYGAPNAYCEAGNAIISDTSVPCLLQHYEHSFLDEQIPSAIAKKLKTLFCEVITVEEDYIVYIDSNYYTVERVSQGAGRDHHLELIIRKSKPV